VLRKIIEIRNVGRLLDYTALGDVELKRYSLIFAENGRGKTTLCSILRSLQTGDAAHVLRRATLGSGEPPLVRATKRSKRELFVFIKSFLAH
jgi:wobble nucleotide-excising tRNase